jgi:hypothetical protein
MNLKIKLCILTGCSFLIIANILILDMIEAKMCKAFSIYRIFTINSTVCKNITLGTHFLEKLFSTTLLAASSCILQHAANYYARTGIQNVPQIKKDETSMLS